MTKNEIDRINSYTLVNYGKDGLSFDDMEKDIEPDPIGECACKLLKGYINVRIGSPILYEDLPLVYMSNIDGYGEHFDRMSLAKCLKSTIEYLFTRPDIYTIQPNTTMSNIRLMSIRYDTYYGHFVAMIKRL